jgi:hypothetical protein
VYKLKKSFMYVKWIAIGKRRNKKTVKPPVANTLYCELFLCSIVDQLCLLFCVRRSLLQ